MNRRSILLLDTEPQTQNHYIALAILDSFRRNPLVDRIFLASYRDAVQIMADEKLDTFVAFGGAERHTDILARLCSMAELSIIWTTEDPYQLAGNVRTSTCFDFVFTNEKASVGAYQGHAHHLPLAASSLFQDFRVPRSDDEYLYDVLFIGTAWPNRVQSLNRLMSKSSKRLKLKLALPWNEFIGPPQLDDESLITNWRCSNRDFARFANRSRIVLTLPRFFSAVSEQFAAGSTPPPRLFETALAGGFQIVASPELDFATYYEPDEEILSCADDDMAIAAITEMLEDPARRLAMAERARARTARENLYDAWRQYFWRAIRNCEYAQFRKLANREQPRRSPL
jgi:spore maturation protein CgeB